MSLTKTPLCEVGKRMNSFALKSTSNTLIRSDDIVGKSGTLIMFLCNHCPYVKAIIKELVKTAKKLQTIGISSVAIMPNDFKNYPEDSFDNMKVFSERNEFCFPYLLDDTQKVAKDFGAVCTPDFFGFDSDLNLRYRGRFIKMQNLKFVNKKNDLFDAMSMIAETKKGPLNQYPSIGCSIKWR